MAVYRSKYRDPKTGKLRSSDVWWYELQWDHKRIRKSTNQASKRVAEQMEAAYRTALAKGEVGILERKAASTLKEFAPKFQREIETACARKPRTVSFYLDKLRILLRNDTLASASLDDIDEQMIDGYKQTRARSLSRYKRLLSPASVNRELCTLPRLLRMAYDWKIIARAPRVRLLDGEVQREFTLSPEQEKLYLGATSGDLHDLAILALDTGLRVGEVLSLEWPEAHLDCACAYLRILGGRSKNSKPRNIPLTARVTAMLRQRGPLKSGLVFHREDGSPLYQSRMNQQHAAIRTLLKFPLECVPHSFRHTYGTRLGEAGVDAFTIMRLMRHSSVTISQRYVHPTGEAMERAVARLEALNEGKMEEVPQVIPQVEKAKYRGKQLTHQFSTRPGWRNWQTQRT